jgi:H/ACA ribonucleoprotein complex subunit 3
MKMDVYLGGAKVKINPKNFIGKGREADVYDIGNNLALKLFKEPDHIDNCNNVLEQKMTLVRLAEHQNKLREFPKNLPKNVIVPQNLATDRTGQKIVGYTMNFLQNAEMMFRYAQKSFRQNGIGNDEALDVLKNLYQTVEGVHNQKVVIGDFNDMNVLVKDREAYLIDADSFQFKTFICKMFTTKFVDPLLCDPKLGALNLIKPHNIQSDWYAYAVMMMQAFLFVGPYGGVYRPKDKNKQLVVDARPLRRITIFDKEVIYPKTAIPYTVLSDDLLQYFHLLFEKDQRTVFPKKILENIKWVECPKCKTEHARGVCPVCHHGVVPLVKEAIEIRGTVTVNRLFRGKGLIVCSYFAKDKLSWLYYENKKLYREDGRLVLEGELNPKMRFRIQGENTLVAQNGLLIKIDAKKNISKYAVGSYGTVPVYDANMENFFWINNGQLMRSAEVGPEYVGDILEKQTFFWVGNEFGFGFYRAGNLNVAFIFNTKTGRINDEIKIPQILGQLLDATVVFTDKLFWFFYVAREGTELINRCVVIDRQGNILGQSFAKSGDGSWLGTLRGKFALGNMLFVATDEGLVRVEINNGQIVVVKKFPDTEPFMNGDCQLYAGAGGLYVVEAREIRVIKMT